MRVWCVIAILGLSAVLANAGPIQDNSFLIEEAYNQEAGVVQHISFLQRALRSNAWIYTFTQEWPVGGQANQFSYTIPIQRPDNPQAGAVGFGDVALNYRYQLVGNGNARVAVAPRASLLLPTGNYRRLRPRRGKRRLPTPASSQHGTF